MKKFCPFSKTYILRALEKDYTGKECQKICYAKVFASNVAYYFQVPVCMISVLLCKIPIIDQIFETISRCWSRGVFGFFMRNVYWRSKLKKIGQDVFIDQGVTIFGAKNVELGDDVHIDVNCCFICATGKIKIGSYVHIAGEVIINGKPFVIIGNHAAIAANAKIYGSTTVPTAPSMSAMSPNNMTKIVETGIIIGDYALIGLNTVVLPGAKLNNYSCVGANSLVDREIPEMTIAIGNPAKVVKKRELK